MSIKHLSYLSSVTTEGFLKVYSLMFSVECFMLNIEYLKLRVMNHEWN